MNPQDSLPLRDIHLPDPVSWWPPAVGWWLLLLLCLALLVSVYLLVKRMTRPILKKSARARVAAVIQGYRTHQDKLRAVQEISIALRRIGISYLPRNATAGMTGEQWYAELNRLVRRNPIGEAALRLLIDIPYQKNPQISDQQLTELFRQTQQWVGALSREKPGV